MKRFGIFALFAIVLLLGYAYYPKSPGTEEKSRMEAVLKASLPDLDGKTQSISQWQGKVLVVNFWASWCPPCRAEMPGFVDLQKKYAGRGLVFVGIALDSPDKAGAFARSIGVNYPVLVDQDSSVLNLSALPYTVVFDRKGGLAATHAGAWPEAELGEIISKLL